MVHISASFTIDRAIAQHVAIQLPNMKKNISYHLDIVLFLNCSRLKELARIKEAKAQTSLHDYKGLPQPLLLVYTNYKVILVAQNAQKIYYLLHTICND